MKLLHHETELDLGKNEMLYIFRPFITFDIEQQDAKFLYTK